MPSASTTSSSTTSAVTDVPPLRPGPAEPLSLLLSTTTREQETPIVELHQAPPPLPKERTELMQKEGHE
jgi:hypothetical protein